MSAIFCGGGEGRGGEGGDRGVCLRWGGVTMRVVLKGSGDGPYRLLERKACAHDDLRFSSSCSRSIGVSASQNHDTMIPLTCSVLSGLPKDGAVASGVGTVTAAWMSSSPPPPLSVPATTTLDGIDEIDPRRCDGGPRCPPGDYAVLPRDRMSTRDEEKREPDGDGGSCRVPSILHPPPLRSEDRGSAALQREKRGGWQGWISRMAVGTCRRCVFGRVCAIPSWPLYITARCSVP